METRSPEEREEGAGGERTWDISLILHAGESGGSFGS